MNIPVLTMYCVTWKQNNECDIKMMLYEFLRMTIQMNRYRNYTTSILFHLNLLAEQFFPFSGIPYETRVRTSLSCGHF